MMRTVDGSRPCRNTAFLVLLLLVASAALSPRPCAASGEQRLRVVYNPGVAPLKFENESGDAMGLFADFWRLWAERAGVSVDIVQAPGLNESIEYLATGSADLHAGIFRTPGRETHLSFAGPILSVDYFLPTLS